MYVVTRGLGATAIGKQQYLDQLESSYKKYISSGMCPFNATILASEDVMENVAETPESISALEEFIESKSYDAMKTPCDGSSGTTHPSASISSPTLPRIRPGGTVVLPGKIDTPAPKMVDVPVPVVRDNRPIFIGIGIVALGAIVLGATYWSKS